MMLNDYPLPLFTDCFYSPTILPREQQYAAVPVDDGLWVVRDLNSHRAITVPVTRERAEEVAGWCRGE